MKYFMGIDPGLKGAVTVISEEKKIVFCKPFEFDIEVNKKGRKMKRPAIESMIKLFKQIHKDFQIELAVIEKQVAMPGQNSIGTFNTGKGYGILLTILTAYRFNYKIIECKDWQSVMIPNRTPVESKLRRDKRKQLKVDSIHRAQELFPDFNFKRSARSKVDNDGLTDSSLMASYCLHVWQKLK